MATYKFMNTLPHITDEEMAAYTQGITEAYEAQGITEVTFNTFRCPEHTELHQAVEVEVESTLSRDEFPFIYQGELIYATDGEMAADVSDAPGDPMEAFLALLMGAGEGGVTNRFSAADLFG